MSKQNSSLYMSDSDSLDDELNKSTNHEHPYKRISVGIPKIFIDTINIPIKSESKSKSGVHTDSDDEEPIASRSNDWRLGKQPYKPKGDSCLSNAAPVTRKVVLDVRSFAKFESLHPAAMTPRSKPKTIKRLGSARSSASVSKKQAEKANNFLSSKFNKNVVFKKKKDQHTHSQQLTLSIPLGPSVVLTALANASTPAFNFLRAASSKTICFAIFFFLL